MKDLIIKHLESGGTVIADNIWHFKGLHMQCVHTMEDNDMEDNEYTCCEDYYESYEESAHTVLLFANQYTERVELA